MKRAPSGLAPIIQVQKGAATSLYRQVYEGYRKAIVDGSLRPGQRVPSTRVLASELGISRMPVLNAYAQLLAEGYFKGRVGSGTVVSRSLPDRMGKIVPAKPQSKAADQERRRVSKRCSNFASAEGFYRLRGLGPFNVSQIGFDCFPLTSWNSLVTRHARTLQATSLDYGDPMGLKELRERIAE